MDLFSLKNFTKISIFILAGKKLGKYQLPPKPQRKELMIVKNDKANNINIKLKIKYFIKDLDFLRAYNSPFKAPKLKWYCGKVALGTPYFFPRTWVKATPELAHTATEDWIKSTEEFNKRNP